MNYKQISVIETFSKQDVTYAVYEYLLLCRLMANLTIGFRTVATMFGSSFADVSMMTLQQVSV